MQELKQVLLTVGNKGYEGNKGQGRVFSVETCWESDH